MAKKKESITIREYISQNALDELIESAFVEQAEAEEELELEFSDLAEETSITTDSDRPDSSLISNDDIAALLKGAGPKKTPAPLPVTEESSGLISQSDIDALLKGGMDALSSTPPKKKKIEPEPSGLVSQSDIDALLKGSLADQKPRPSTKTEPESEPGGIISQSDIDALLGGGFDEGTSSATPPKTEPDNAFDGLISQNDIDALLKGSDISAPVEEGGIISQSDIDSLLSGTSNDLDGEPATSGLVSQSDIDALLGGASPEVSETQVHFDPKERDEQGDVISQSDIDALLKGALEEDSGNTGEAEKRPPAISQSDIDSLFEADSATTPEEKIETKPVILAEADEAGEDEPPSVPVERKRWYARRAYQIGAMAALVLLVSSVVLYVKTRPRDIAPKVAVLRFPIPKAESQTVTPKMVGVTSIAMTGFLVLAPSENTDMTCLTADVMLDFMDTATLRRVKENEGVIRNVIYSVIHDAVLSSKKEMIEKAHLARVLKEAIGRVIQGDMIRSVSFGKFDIT